MKNSILEIIAVVIILRISKIIEKGNYCIYGNWRHRYFKLDINQCLYCYFSKQPSKSYKMFILKFQGFFFFYFSGLKFKKVKSRMFTFGIFTTHLPYVAFVVFYAYFLLFGMKNLPVQEENKISQSKLIIQVQSDRLLSDQISGSCYYYKTLLDISIKKNLGESIFREKINHQCCLDIGYWQDILSTSIFSRPPPSLI